MKDFEAHLFIYFLFDCLQIFIYRILFYNAKNLWIKWPAYKRDTTLLLGHPHIITGDKQDVPSLSGFNAPLGILCREPGLLLLPSIITSQI